MFRCRPIPKPFKAKAVPSSLNNATPTPKAYRFWRYRHLPNWKRSFCRCRPNCNRVSPATEADGARLGARPDMGGAFLTRRLAQSQAILTQGHGMCSAQALLNRVLKQVEKFFAALLDEHGGNIYRVIAAQVQKAPFFV